MGLSPIEGRCHYVYSGARPFCGTLDSLMGGLYKTPLSQFKRNKPEWAFRYCEKILVATCPDGAFQGQLLTEAEGDFPKPLYLLDLCLTKVTKYGNLVTKYGNFEKGG